MIKLKQHTMCAKKVNLTLKINWKLYVIPTSITETIQIT